MSDTDTEKWETQSVLSQNLKRLDTKTSQVKPVVDLSSLAKTGYICSLCGKILKSQTGMKKHYQSSGCLAGAMNTPLANFKEIVKKIAEKYQTLLILNESEMYPKNEKEANLYTIKNLLFRSKKLYSNFLTDYDDLKHIYVSLCEIEDLVNKM